MSIISDGAQPLSQFSDAMASRPGQGHETAPYSVPAEYRERSIGLCVVAQWFCVGDSVVSVMRRQIMEYTERCVAVSEPTSTTIVSMKYQKFGDSPETRRLARDIIRWECRPYPTMQPPPLGYIVKLTSICIVALPMFRQYRLCFIKTHVHC